MRTTPRMTTPTPKRSSSRKRSSSHTHEMTQFAITETQPSDATTAAGVFASPYAMKLLPHAAASAREHDARPRAHATALHA
eukprot:3584731-Pleurochrysis_carterae.AAC.1